MTDTRNTPTLTQVLEQAAQGSLRGVRTWLPGRIETYDAVARRATVQVLPADGYIDEDGQRVPESIAPLTDVPVVFMGSGAVRVKMPVSAGDQCVVLFASSSIARFKATERAEPYDPGDDRRHRLADAIAIPLVMVGDDVESETMIAFDGDELRLGADSAAQSVLRGEAFLSAFSTLVSAMAVAVGPPGQAGIETALTAFENVAATYKSPIAKVP